MKIRENTPQPKRYLKPCSSIRTAKVRKKQPRTGSGMWRRKCVRLNPPAAPGHCSDPVPGTYSRTSTTKESGRYDGEMSEPLAAGGDNGNSGPGAFWCRGLSRFGRGCSGERDDRDV